MSFNLKMALEVLYSIDTSSSPLMLFLRRFSGFLGKINEAFPFAVKSVLEYRTNLCASVATKVMSSSLN